MGTRIRRSDSGVALLAALLLLLLISALVVGFATTVVSDVRMRSVDRDRTQAFYAAHAGLEKLTADLGDLFTVTFRPTGAQVNALTANPPTLPDISFAGNSRESGYRIQFPSDPNGNPLAENRTIPSGPFQGFMGLITPYTISAVARTASGGETSLSRTMQTVSIPVFQFGMFSEVDLSFFAGPNFDFGGRVHTNGNLYLAEGSANNLTLRDRVTIVGEAIRTNLSNGWDTSSNYTGNVLVTTVPGSFRNLARTEGSLVGTTGSALNEPLWSNLSLGTYNGNIRNTRTGSRRLDLPLVRDGAQPIDIIRRPNPAAPDPATVAPQRFFQMASLRILLSDTAADITSLPTVTPQAPVDLANITASGYVIDNFHPPVAASRNNIPANPDDNYTVGQTAPFTPVPLVNGFIKMERQLPNGTWVDVTLEILNRGIAGPNIARAPGPPIVNNRHQPESATQNCAAFDPQPNAIVRLQRIRDDPQWQWPCGVQAVTRFLSGNSYDYWPNVLYDAREAIFRNSLAAQSELNVALGGVVHYIELDVRNLTLWLQAQGGNIMQDTGYVVYFSDRRGNRNSLNQETGEYGFEDFVNPASATGLPPNNTLDAGEDVNGNGQLDTYGQTPIVPAGSLAPLAAAARPWTLVPKEVARVNRPLFFRRALKIVNGVRGNIIMPGLTIASENPVYLQGDYNANTAEGVPATYTLPHAATAIIADSVTFLSNAWNDIRSFLRPHDPNGDASVPYSGRFATNTTYRVAIISGKGPSFPRPTAGAPPQDFGTDGGVHNFLRYIETWSGQTLNYRGSIVSFYFNRQALGTYKCCSNVYSPPTRNYQFDIDFLQPSLLPPRTPMFRDVNTTGFTQVVTPR